MGHYILAGWGTSFADLGYSYGFFPPMGIGAATIPPYIGGYIYYIGY